MMKKETNIIIAISLLISFIVVLSIYKIFGIYYEAYEGFLAAAINGELTNGHPWSNFFYMGYLLIGNFISFLGKIFPIFNWYDIMSYLFLILSLSFMYLLIILNYLKYKYNIFILFLYILIVTLLCIENIVNFQITRIAFMLSFAPLCLLSYILASDGFRLDKYMYYFSFILFAMGLMYRPQSAIFSFGLTIIYFVINYVVFRRYLLQIVPFALLLIFYFIYLYYEMNIHQGHYAFTESGIEYQIMQGNVIGISEMKSEVDSIKYIAAISGVFIDPNNLSKQFLTQIIKKDLFNNIFNNINIFMYNGIDNYLYYKFELLLMLLMFSLFLYLRKYKLIFFYLVSTFVLTIVLIIMKSERRFIYPVIFVLLFVGLFFTVSSLSRKKLIVFFLLFLVAELLILFRTRDNCQAYKHAISINKQMLKSLQLQSQDKMLIPDFTVFNSLYFNNTLPFQSNSGIKFKNVLHIDMAAWSLTPVYKQYLDRKCNCDSQSFYNFFRFLRNNKADVIFAGQPERFKLFENYLNILNKDSFQFKKTAVIVSSDRSFSFEGLQQSYSLFIID